MGDIRDDTALMCEGRPFDRALAEEYGLKQHEVTGLLAAGGLRHVVRGVYLDARVADDLTSRAACLRLKLPPGAVVSRLTAAWLWGVDGRAPDERAALPAIECTVPPGRQPIRRPGVRCYVAHIGDEITEVGGVPVTPPLRTALDVLRWLRPHMALAICDALAATGLLTAEAVAARVADAPGLRGITQARRLAGLVEARAESFGESWLRLRIVDAGFPRPRVQLEVHDASGRCAYRLDLGWEDLRIAVEYDGEAFHSTRRQVEHDRRRREVLEQTYGWQVLAVGRGEVLGTSLALERAVGELLGREPVTKRRRW